MNMSATRTTIDTGNVRSCTHGVAPAGLCVRERNKDNNRHAKEDRGKTTRSQPYTKIYMQLRNAAESQRNSLSQGRAPYLVIQY